MPVPEKKKEGLEFLCLNKNEGVILERERRNIKTGAAHEPGPEAEEGLSHLLPHSALLSNAQPCIRWLASQPPPSASHRIRAPNSNRPCAAVSYPEWLPSGYEEANERLG